MPLRQSIRRKLLTCCPFLLVALASTHAFGDAALMLEQPYGFFGTVNPTGHAAIFLERVCADTPVHLRLCNPGETGVVISRYSGIAGYDWAAIPLLPYLYAVEDPALVPKHVDEETVDRLRNHYREARLDEWMENLPPGGFLHGGWTQLVGAAYNRNIYAFRFATTQAQDEQLIARLNSKPNRSHFNLLFNNCADFDRNLLNHYFPGVFGRTIFPDAGITTPKHITYKLVKYSKRHPETELTILAIPQIPGYRRNSRSNHGVAESLVTTSYVIPIVILNPYVAGGLLADYLVRGRYRVVPKDPEVIDAEHLDALTTTLQQRPEKPAAPPAEAVANQMGQTPTLRTVKPALTGTLTQPSPEQENPFSPLPKVAPALPQETPLSSPEAPQPTHP